MRAYGSSIPALLCLLLFASNATGLEFQAPLGTHEWYAEFSDPYYIATGLYFSLTGSAAPQVNAGTESQVYSYLTSSTIRPNTFLLELGGYPMQAAGAGIRAWAPNGYRKAHLGSTNLVQALTGSADFPEPWSVSAFLGHMVRFTGKEGGFEGRGNAGLLCSYGNLHIKDNLIYPDHWGEFEFKIKVDDAGKARRYATSYRIGGRFHGNTDIKSLIYLSLRRDRTDFSEPRFSLIENTNYEIRGDLGVLPTQLLKVSGEIGKKFPLTVRNKTYVLGLSFGLTWEVNNPYKNTMGEGFEKNRISVSLKPLIRF